ncbi:glycosyltransferase [Tatumella sp. JGM118]|uniref:glycosyltransferase n=1 Tax=Tatumella sp. JGM118 TaxID=2799796 RepID=UPI001BAFE1A0|nr:glycosyltransferase [Tatumella sp. JGM118]MBS0910583.1 glycosyltransferase [Tatumella sp. JGM118]
MKMTPLIVTYNRLEKLQKSLAATLALPFDSIVVIDNDSTDGTREWLKAQSDPRLHCCFSPVNSGGAGGFSRGVAYIAENLTTDWVVFYDDDAWPDPSFIDNFSRIVDGRYELYCARVLSAEGRLCPMNVPWSAPQDTFFAAIHSLVNKHAFIPDPDTPGGVCTFSFVGAIVSSRLIRESGDLIEKDFFIYFDDVCYSWRLFSQGNPILYHPELIMHHDVPSAVSDLPAWKHYYLLRNLLVFRRLRDCPPLFGRTATALRIAHSLLRAMKSPQRLYCLRLLVKAVWHAFSGKRPMPGKPGL